MESFSVSNHWSVIMHYTWSCPMVLASDLTISSCTTLLWRLNIENWKKNDGWICQIHLPPASRSFFWRASEFCKELSICMYMHVWSSMEVSNRGTPKSCISTGIDTPRFRKTPVKSYSWRPTTSTPTKQREFTFCQSMMADQLWFRSSIPGPRRCLRRSCCVQFTASCFGEYEMITLDEATYLLV